MPKISDSGSNRKKDIPLQWCPGGHSDNVGPAAYNMTLSERRAKSVMKYFVDKGVEAQRLTTKGFGFTQPAASNDTEQGRARNRRVELTPVKQTIRLSMTIQV